LLARNSAAAESEGGQKFLPPNPLPFCPPERFGFAREARNHSGFSSKKVRTSIKKHRKIMSAANIFCARGARQGFVLRWDSKGARARSAQARVGARGIPPSPHEKFFPDAIGIKLCAGGCA
jgi:hypothetical protein